MNSQIFIALCLIGLVAVISANESMPKGTQLDRAMAAPESGAHEAPEAVHSRVRRQWGYGMGGYGMGGYGMGMYRPWGMGMYRPYGMMGMYRPWGMMGMYG